MASEGGRRGLRIGLIVDGFAVSKYVYDFAGDLARRLPEAQIAALIIQNVERKRGVAKIREVIAKRGWKSLVQQTLFSFMIRAERLLLARYPRHRAHLETRDGRGLAAELCDVTPIVSKSGFVYRYPPEVIERIRALDLDVLVRLGSGILKGEILSSARHGVVSFHHADNRINRGGPAGFWEVYYRQESTGFILQKLTEDLDGGDILVRGHFATQPFFLLNQAFLYAKSNVYLTRVMEVLDRTGKLPVVEDDSVYSGPLYRLPGTAQQIRYLAAAVWRLFTRFVQFRLLKRRYRWGVGFLKGDWKRSVLWRAETLPNPPGHFLADPFVLQWEGADYVFVEDYDEAVGKGCIAAYRIDGKAAVRLGPALVEDFHLSFPFLFRRAGELFMCPESSEARQIRLYRCTEFPLKWELHRVVMDGVEAMDSMFVPFGGRWWLMTNIDPAAIGDHSSELYLFHSDDPVEGAWTPHPANPVIVDSRRARNGGILADGDALFRVAQRQGFGAYGKSFTINRITHLDPRGYDEEELCEVLPAFFPGLKRTHHLHSNGRLTVFDFARLEPMR